MKRCYYDVLEVDRKATPAEIKTNYRKMALKYHPDKNSEEGAKERFVEINEAYNVLSDPNERTWYDSNREKLLFNKEDMSKEDVDQFTFGFNIYAYFTTACFTGYADDEHGFFAVYRTVFEKIKTEEAKAYSLREDLAEDQRKYEGFGDSTTSEARVLQFYEDWENFSTYKTFVWSEEWDTREAGSRWERREMEKENKKTRQGERKTYVKTIKDLLAYVRKRDPRFIAYLAALRDLEEKKQQEKLEREKEKKKEKEEMKHVKQRLEEERFREIEEYYRQQNQTANLPKQPQSHAHHQQQEDQEHESEFYCEICEKEFKSENQLRNHEKSKQHKQMLKDIEKEVLLKEEILARADQEEEQPPQPQQPAQNEEPSPAKKKKNKKKKQQQQKEEAEEQDEEPEEPKQEKKQEKKEEKKPEKKEEKPERKEESSSEDDDHFMNTLLNNRNKKTETKPQPPAQPPQPAPKDKKKPPAKVEESASEEEEEQEAKLGKAKLKKQKKAEQAEKGKGSELKCKGCAETFPSKTKLFEHINKTGHATAK